MANKSLDFEASNNNEYIDYDNVFTTDAFTVAGWFKLETVGNLDCLIVKRNAIGTTTDDDDVFQLDISTNAPRFAVYDSSQSVILNISSGTALSTATWYFIAAVSNGNGNTAYIYVDGIEKASGTQTGVTSNSADSAIQLGARIGGDNNRWYDGLISQFHAYNRGLSIAEIQEIQRNPGSIRNGLQIYSPLEDGSANDFSGNGNHGVIKNGVTASTDGPTINEGGASLDFELSDAADFVGYGDAMYSDALTVAAWIKLESSTDVRMIALKRNTVGTSTDATAEWQFLTGATNIVQCSIWEDGTGKSATSTGTVADATWTFVACSVEAIGGTMRLYINGVEDGTAARHASKTITNSTSGIQVGCRSANNNNRWFDGLIAHFHLYNRALSQAEVQEIQRNPGSIRNGLQIYSPFDGNSALDLSGNDNHGTWYGSVVTSTDGPTIYEGGASLDFDGSSGYLNYDGGVVTATPLTVALWMNPSVINQTDAMLWGIETKGASTNCIRMFQKVTEVIQIQYYDGSSRLTTSTSTVAAGNWYHITAVFPDTTDCRIYFNGTQEDSDSAFQSAITMDVTVIGATEDNATYKNFFNGKIAHIGFWNVELSDAEITDLASGVTPDKIQTSSLKCYLPNMGHSGRDFSGQGNHMTFNGTISTSYLGPPILISMPFNPTRAGSATASSETGQSQLMGLTGIIG